MSAVVVVKQLIVQRTSELKVWVRSVGERMTVERYGGGGATRMGMEMEMGKGDGLRVKEGRLRD